MTNHIEIPEELKELIKEIVVYEDNNEEIECPMERAYIDPPDLYKQKDQISDTDVEENWKIEINI